MYRSGHSGAHQHSQAVLQQGTAGVQHLPTQPKNTGLGASAGVAEGTPTQNISPPPIPAVSRKYIVLSFNNKRNNAKKKFCTVCSQPSPI